VWTSLDWVLVSFNLLNANTMSRQTCLQYYIDGKYNNMIIWPYTNMVTRVADISYSRESSRDLANRWMNWSEILIYLPNQMAPCEVCSENSDCFCCWLLRYIHNPVQSCKILDVSRFMCIKSQILTLYIVVSLCSMSPVTRPQLGKLWTQYIFTAFCHPSYYQHCVCVTC
jgi:hypothetical protein